MARNLFAIRYSLFASLLAFAATAVAPAQAQDWPQRPVKLLVPFAAGGNIDVMGRLAAQRLSEALGQQFIVENRVGGNGIIATEAVARAPADGYTLLVIGANNPINSTLYANLSFDLLRDFARVCRRDAEHERDVWTVEIGVEDANAAAE